MKQAYRRSCGMDVHKETVVVCVLPPVGYTGEPIRKTYGTPHPEEDALVEAAPEIASALSRTDPALLARNDPRILN